MCGIAGIVPRRPSDPAGLDRLVRRMTAALRHRGPDDEGYFVSADVALGARRLSIIDRAQGHQPVATDDGAQIIVFNGEIYNHAALRAGLERRGATFRTRCDTEVALQSFHRAGSAGLLTLEGMFALAIWDARRRTLTLARDWMGQKSIYYAETSAGWAFASEIKALLALDLLPRRVDFATLSHDMSLRYLPGPGTLFEGISKVPAAHRVDVGPLERRFTRLWRPSYGPKWKDGEPAALEAFESLLRSVVAEHLMSEVPLGAFLSGGIDSSLIVACAAEALPGRLRTFSVGVHEASQSELPWARAVAERYGTVHLERVVEPDLALLAPRMVAALEEPVDPFAAGVHLVAEATAGHVTVALGGDGGDELFAGYDRYLGQRLAHLYARLPAPLRRRVLGPLLRAVPETFGYKSVAAKLRWLDRVSESTGVERYADSAAFLRFPHALKAEIFEPALWADIGRRDSGRLLEEYFADGCAEAFVDKMLHADCMTRLADHLLPIVDRMSMAHSLEVRSPFLDRRVAEFAMRLPASWKVRRGSIKYFTRRLASRLLPESIARRPKQGFGFPLALWLRGPLRRLIEEVAARSRLAEAGVFRPATMRRLVEEHVGGRVDHNFRLWMLFNLEVWHRHFIDGEPADRLVEWIDRARGGRGPARAGPRTACAPGPARSAPPPPAPAGSGGAADAVAP